MSTIKTASDKRKGKRPAVLKANPILADKKFAIVSMISPEDKNRQCDTYGLKIHDTCADEETARDLCEKYRDDDPDFDVGFIDVGQWVPWVWDFTKIKNAVYHNKELDDLIRSKREQQREADKGWQKKVTKDVEKLEHYFTEEGQAELAKEKESVVSMLFKIRQLEHVITRRKQELEGLRKVYNKNYTLAERKSALKLDLPISEVTPMQYVLLNSATEIPKEETSPSAMMQSMVQDTANVLAAESAAHI